MGDEDAYAATLKRIEYETLEDDYVLGGNISYALDMFQIARGRSAPLYRPSNIIDGPEVKKQPETYDASQLSISAI